MKIFGVAGWKNGGKTGLVERLVKEIVSQGYSVSTIKHAHHETNIDHEGTDSFRHRGAGASQVILSSPDRWAIMSETVGREEITLDRLLEKLDPVDLVLIEGYKSSVYPKIEAHRLETGKTLLALENDTVVAVACNWAPDISQPVFDLDDTTGIAKFILAQVNL
jgi:molybdopterin-guanine dinucleotide biosynthesis protein MobB